MQVQLIQARPEKILFEIAGFPGKCPQSAGTLGTAQVAGRSGFKGNGHRRTPVNRFFDPFADIKRTDKLHHIPDAQWRQF